MIYNLLQSIQRISNVSVNFADKCIKGIKVNKSQIKENLDKNLMLVTRLTPLIGYEQAAAIAHEAFEKNLTLKEVLLSKNLLSSEKIDEALDPSKMISPNK